MTCKECKHFEPAENPVTGRVLPSKDGRCRWTFPWPENWPQAYYWGGSTLPRRPYQPVTMGWWGEGCKTFEPNKGRKNELLPKM
jgi:hypothetical protein